MESFLPTLLFKLRGLDSYPGGTSTHWFMPAFAGRTHPVTNLGSASASAIMHPMTLPGPQTYSAECQLTQHSWEDLFLQEPPAK
jgi:hypothetical protein